MHRLVAAAVLALSSPAARADPHFADCAPPTGATATVLLPDALHANGRQLLPGDEVALFTAGGACAGAAVWDGGRLALAAWADDPTTGAVEGYASGEPLAFAVWRAGEGVEERGLGAVLDPAYEPTPAFAPDAIYLALALTGAPPPPPAPPGPGREAESPGAVEPGLAYAYYEGGPWEALPDFAALTPAETGVESGFGLGARNRDDDFAFVFTGYVSAPADGAYTFYTTSDDGSRLLIGGTVVVDNDGLHGAQERSGSVALRAGLHGVRVEFFERGWGEVLAVEWAGPGVERSAIPADRLVRVAASPPAPAPPPEPAPPEPTPPATLVWAVNTGGGAYTATDGTAYATDEGASGGSYYSTSAPIERTDDDELYQTERYGSYAYRVPLPAGRYEVTLQMAELYWGGAGRRRFDVLLEGEEVLADFDLFAAAGASNAAYDLRFAVDVADGALDLAVRTDLDNGTLGAVAVRALPPESGFGGPAARASVEGDAGAGGLPAAFALGRAFPNPARAQVTVPYELPAPADVTIEAFDLLGRRVAVLAAGRFESGRHRAHLDGNRLPAGVYVVRAAIRPDGDAPRTFTQRLTVVE